MPSQTLSLSQSQRLQMMLAPQLRQSLEMLQVPILELRAMIQSELEQNPTIEEVPSAKETVEIEPGDGQVDEKAAKEEMDFDKEFEALAKLDDEWRDYFFQDLQQTSHGAVDEEKRQFMMDSIPQKESLQEHLMAQLHLAELSEADSQIGELLIGSIDDDGYLTVSIEELAESTGTDPEQLSDILLIVQDFHPTGVGARDLKECLLIQLDRLDNTDSLAATLVRDHLDRLGGRKYADIARALKITPEEVQQAAKIVATLDPKPGRVYSDEATTYVLAEIVVQKIDGRYVVVLNDDQLPHVRISNHYRKLMQEAETKPEVKQYIQERIRAGAFLIKSIHQRQRTIERIACEIVETQQEFLDHGVSHLKPLTMAEIAEVVGVHETTVSRAVSGKYMKTPKGIYELKYFFTPGIRTSDGGQVSNKTVKDIINSLVGTEDPEKPLSDQELMAKLKEKGINIARRTIAKYRLMLRIPPSHMRKSY
ncbi:MAG: RNA polymerase factor sigma-54 [Verrucomicrobia bacterium]|nr:RNA polymerase factor sigma-54 [Verrucomicrobiota bacterium]